MVTLVLPSDITNQIERALVRSGRYEVGGVLMAEHVGPNEFVVREITVHRRGAFALFWRKMEEAMTALQRFFARTEQDYTRFNYIGEWHSHPSFDPLPSSRDHESMYEIVSDAIVGANFVVLVIVKLQEGGFLTGSAHSYLPDGTVERSRLVVQRDHVTVAT
jgi:proteasome lid subunit RPN8/RPN11